MAPISIALISENKKPCGVEAFARNLIARRTGIEGHVYRGPISFAREACRGNIVLMNFPLVAWKRRVMSPIVIAVLAKSLGLKLVIILHEWEDLNWKRRTLLAPIVRLSDVVLFSSPEVFDQYRASRLSFGITKPRALVPIPPNVQFSGAEVESSHSRELSAHRSRGRIIVGQFGSIYPRKQSDIVLEVVANLRAKGQDAAAVFVGTFVRGVDDVESNFWSRASSLGLEGRVVVTGYVHQDDEVFSLLRSIDVFAYAFKGGLTSRRGSILACAAAGRPVVVNRPLSEDEFAHHPTYRRVIASGLISFVPTNARADELTEAVLAAAKLPTRSFAIDTDLAWQDAAEAVEAAIRG